MKKRTIFSIISVSFAMALGAVGALKNGTRSEVRESKAAGGVVTTNVVYCAISTATLGSYTLKINSNYENDAQEYWTQENMIEIDDDQFGANVKVFSGHYKEMWGGVNHMQFQLYDGSTHKGQKQPISSWTSGSWEGKLFNYDTEAWVNDYTPPAQKALDEYTYSYSINGGEYTDLVKNNSTEFMTSTSVVLSVDDVLTFKRDGEDFNVIPKDSANSPTRVIQDGNSLRVIEAVNDVLYLDLTSSALWAGLYTVADGEYLVGSFNGWSVKQAIALPAASVTFAAGTEMKKVDISNRAIDWSGEINADDDNVLSTPAGAVIRKADTTNVQVVTAGTYDVEIDEQDRYVFENADLQAAVFSYSLNGGEYTNLVDGDSSQKQSATALNLQVGDVLRFKKDGVALTVTPKDDDALTKVVTDGDGLRVIQANNDIIYLNFLTNKLWAGAYTLADGQYLVGDFNNWGVKEALPLPVASLTLAAWAKVKAVNIVSNAFDNETWVAATDSNVISMPAGAAAKEAGESTNAQVVTAGTYAISVADGKYYFRDTGMTVTLKVGSTEYPMEFNSGTEWKKLGVALTHGQHISYKINGTEVTAGNYTAKAVGNNNLTSSKNVIADAASADVYIDINAATVWAGGLTDVGGYHLLKNGSEFIELHHTDGFDGYTQYASGDLSFAVNDTIEYIDCTFGNSLPVIFHDVELNPAGYGSKFELVSTVLTCVEACSGELYLKIHPTLANEVYIGGEREEIAAAKAFAQEFLTNMGAACRKDYGYTGVVKATVVSAWNALKDEYTGLASEVKTELLKGDESIYEDVRDFAEAYVGIYARRGVEFELVNYMGFDIPASSNYVSPVALARDNVAAVAILGVSILVISAAGLFFFAKKKKTR